LPSRTEFEARAAPRHAGIIRQGRGEEMASETSCNLTDSAYTPFPLSPR